uniref:Uncharacterized protein n=1 Tax=Brassica campestris TaxID=3711 RepID=A0A3P5YI70_BRACM|nr:unnamed protein product [Brassica rapa]
MKKVAMITGPKIAPTLILKRILMKEILSQYHQTLTTLITTPVIVLVEKLTQKKAMKVACLKRRKQ